MPVQSRSRLERAAGHIRCRHVFIQERVDERGVRPVFQKAPHQIRQQIFMAANGRIDAHIAQIRERLGGGSVKRLAHAVQTLELIRWVASLGCNLTHRAQGVSVMRGELREDRVRRRQHHARAGQIVEIGRRLGRPDREVRLSVHLGEFDLGIPIGAFHQTHHETAPAILAELDQLLQHCGGALLIGLDHNAEAIPARQGRIARQPVEYLQLNDQTITLFRVQAEAQISGFRRLRQLQRARIELVHHLVLLDRLIPRVQRRQLDAHTIHILHAAGLTLGGDDLDGFTVFLQITLGVSIGARTFTQHVKAEERLDRPVSFPVSTAFDRALDIAAEYKLLSQNAHSATRGGADDRLSEPAGHLLEILAGVFLSALVHLQDGAGHHQTQRGGVDQPVIGLPGVFDPGP